MSLDTLLEPTPEPQSASLCKVGMFIDALSEPHKSALRTLVDTRYRDGGLTDEHLAARMVTAGLIVGATTVRRHRSGHCVCKKGINR